MELISSGVGFASDLLTIIASTIAIWIFFFKRKELASVFDLLINYSNQLTLSELKETLERINEYNARNPSDKERIEILFSELIGQIKGSEKLKSTFINQIEEIEALIDNDKMTEPRKRGLVSEIREKLRHLNISNIDKFVGEKNE